MPNDAPEHSCTGCRRPSAEQAAFHSCGRQLPSNCPAPSTCRSSCRRCAVEVTSCAAAAAAATTWQADWAASSAALAAACGAQARGARGRRCLPPHSSRQPRSNHRSQSGLCAGLIPVHGPRMTAQPRTTGSRQICRALAAAHLRGAWRLHPSFFWCAFCRCPGRLCSEHLQDLQGTRSGKGSTRVKGLQHGRE